MWLEGILMNRPDKRGTNLAPANRFETVRYEPDPELWTEPPDDARPATQFLADHSRTVITTNDSPDIPFRFSINPYRGCEHGCSYCYARVYHEFAAMNAGIDFETKILVKHDVARLLRAELAKPSWKGELIAVSGVTDCYQPAEHRFRLTHDLLEVMLECRQPVGLITKNALVLRDLPLLAELASHRLVQVYLSITTLDADLARSMEPRTSTPAARLRAVRTLADAGVPVGVMMAPIIPGLTDREIPSVLEAAAGAGARSAGWTLLKLPGAVEPIFRDWLARTRPLAKSRVESTLRRMRDGNLVDSRFGTRQTGTGERSEQIAQMFQVFADRFGLSRRLPETDSSQFRPPAPANGQMRLFV